jgi:hypothetical protein
MSFWSAIANFFRGFHRSLPALVTGIAVGWATWGLGSPILSGLLGGLSAAAVNTAINGGNWGQAIGMGAVLGGIAGGIGGDVFKGFGGIPDNGFNWGNFVAGVKTGAAFGAVIGGLNTAIHGGNFFQNVALGALGGAVSSAAAFGIMKGATEAWNSMVGTEAGQTAQRADEDISCKIDPTCSAQQKQFRPASDYKRQQQYECMNPVAGCNNDYHPTEVERESPRIDPRCKMCVDETTNKIPSRGCNVFGGKCTPDGEFQPRTSPSDFETKVNRSLPEILKWILRESLRRGGAADE